MTNKECRMSKAKDAYSYFDIRHSLFIIRHSIGSYPSLSIRVAECPPRPRMISPHPLTVLTKEVMMEKKGNHGDTEGTELHGEKEENEPVTDFSQHPP